MNPNLFFSKRTFGEAFFTTVLALVMLYGLVLGLSANDLINKRQEFNIFFIAVGSSPFIALLACYLSHQAFRWIWHRKQLSLVIQSIIFILGVFISYQLTYRTYFDPAFRAFLRIPFNPEFLKGTVPIVSLLFAFILIFKKEDQASSPNHKRIRKLIYMSVFLFMLFAQVSWRISGIESADDGVPYVVELEAVLYSVVQALHGRIPLVDYTAQYGYYGIFLAPLFKLVGFSLLKFTILMTLLQTIAMISVILFASQWIQSNLLFAIACVAISYSASGWRLLHESGAPYFQYYPIRFLFPAIFLPIVTVWLNHPRIRLTALLTLFSLLAVIWNLDSGVPVMGTWLACLFLVPMNLKEPFSSYQGFKNHFWVAGVTILISVFALFLLFWIAGGRLDHLHGFLVFQSSAVKNGVFMNPIPKTFHFWQVVCLTYLICVIAGMMRVFGYFRSKFYDVLFILGLLGFGLFIYYFGRAADTVLYAVLWPWTLILFLIADRVMRVSKNGGFPKLLAYVFTSLVLWVGIPMVSFYWIGTGWILGIVQSHYDEMVHKPRSTLRENVQWIKKSIPEGEDVAIFSIHQALYYAESGIKPFMRGPGQVELMFDSDIKWIRYQLSQNPPKHLLVDQYSIDQVLLSQLDFNLKAHYQLLNKSPDQALMHFVLTNSTEQ